VRARESPAPNLWFGGYQGPARRARLIPFVDRRQLREVALDARGELLERLVRADDLQVCLAPPPLSAAPGLEAEPAVEPRPFRRNENGDRTREECDPDDAHKRDSTDRGIGATLDRGFTNPPDPFTLKMIEIVPARQGARRCRSGWFFRTL